MISIIRSKSVIFVLLAIIVSIYGLAQATEEPMPKLTLISNVNVFDGKTDHLLTNMHVLVKDNLIETVSKEPLAVIQTDNVTTIDGGGRTLMPGLIDAHWHSYYAYVPQSALVTGDMSEVAIWGFIGAGQTLMRGFTTVRDIGGNPFAVKKFTDTGDYPGPRLYISGPPLSQTSGHFDFRGKNDVPANNTDPLTYWERNGVIMVADGVAEVTKRAREILRMGATQLKIAGGGGVSSSYDPLDVQEYTFEEMKAVVDVADTWNTYVAAHIFTDKAVQTAVKAGVKSIEHGMLIEKRETFEMMKKEGAWLCIQPLLNDEDALHFDDPFSTQKWNEVTAGTVNAYKLAKEVGVNIAFGTDMLFDPAAAAKQGKMLSKLKLWFTPYETLKMATYDNARLIKMCGPRDPYPHDIGVVKQGAYADLLIVEGNPLEDLDLVADPEKNFVMIMKDGKIYKNTIK